MQRGLSRSDWGIVLRYDINPSGLAAPGHLPLHKGGKFQPRKSFTALRYAATGSAAWVMGRPTTM